MTSSSNLLTDIVSSLLDVEIVNRTSDLTNQLQEEATKAGWPTVVVMQLSIEVINGELDVQIPASIRETVEILEYGTETTPPNPVIRNFLKSLNNRVGSL